MDFYDLRTNARTAPPASAPVVALGNFDGVHLGHQKLLYEAVRLSLGMRGTVPIVWTFDVTPRAVVTGQPVPTLSTLTERMEQFRRCGIAYAAIESFEAVRGLTPEAFVDTVLCGKLRASAVVCGFNFRFGRGGAGDVETLSRLLGERNIPLTVIDPVEVEGTVVSSTHIRSLIAAGETEEAQKFLGYAYFFDGIVRHGKHLGTDIGFPTVNLAVEPDRLLPKNGIYCTTVDIGEDVYVGVTNVGSRPTVNDDGSDVTVETHIVGTDEILYGRRIRVNFYRRLRDEQKFDSLDDLRAAIEADKKHAEEYFCFL